MNGEQPKKPAVPDDLKAPGLIFRLRREGWEMWWAPRSDLAKRGSPVKMARLRAPSRTPPTRAEWEVICGWCHRHNQEQLVWARGGSDDDPNSWFDGSIAGLVRLYEKHRKSPYHAIRHDSAHQYACALAAIKGMIGSVRVENITFDDITDWQTQFADDGEGGKPRKARAANLIGHLKRICIFGALIFPKHEGLRDVCAVFARMAEADLMGSYHRQRHSYMTAVQARLLRAKAHEMGWHSIALEQAFAFELGVRQKDVIGEWIPRSHPGVTDVYDGPRKWQLGMRWEEIDENFILTHRLSKSLRGRNACMDAEAGKMKAWDLREYPMIMQELERMVMQNAAPREPGTSCRGTGVESKLYESRPLSATGAVTRDMLPEYPMIMDELIRIGAQLRQGCEPATAKAKATEAGGPTRPSSASITRADLPATGPLIIRDGTRLPWVRQSFRAQWRVIARAAGLPDTLQNRDSRPGAATEADLAGAAEEKVQRGLGHAKRETTRIYLRDDLEVNRELARIRVEKRK